MMRIEQHKRKTLSPFTVTFYRSSVWGFYYSCQVHFLSSRRLTGNQGSVRKKCTFQIPDMVKVHRGHIVHNIVIGSWLFHFSAAFIQQIVNKMFCFIVAARKFIDLFFVIADCSSSFVFVFDIKNSSFRFSFHHSSQSKIISCLLIKFVAYCSRLGVVVVLFQSNLI